MAKGASQLSLFNVKPTAEHRWPRGYTPERQAEVASRLPSPDVAYHQPQHGGDQSMFLPSRPFFTPSEDDPHRGKWSRSHEGIDTAQSEQAHRAITDVVARSTVPIEHLEAAPTLRVSKLAQAAGTYHHPGQELSLWKMGESVPDPEGSQRGRISVDPDATRRSFQERTVIHELGHHVDYQTDPERFMSRHQFESEPVVGGGRASPKLEGFAEGYATAHYRPRRGEAPDPTDRAYEDFQRNPHFQERYYGVAGQYRENKPSASSGAGTGAWPPKQGFQQHLFARREDVSTTMTEKDYGQWELEHVGAERDPAHYDPVELSTIKVGRGVPPEAERMQPGFEPGDQERVYKMQHRYGEDVSPEHRQRIKSAWSRLYPNEPLG